LVPLPCLVLVTFDALSFGSGLEVLRTQPPTSVGGFFCGILFVMAKQLPTVHNDFRTIQGVILEHEVIHGQLVLYERQTLRNDELLDTLHMEVLDSAREFAPSVKIRVERVQPDPPQQLLAKWGIDEQRDIVLYPTVIGLAESGLARYPDNDVTRRPEFEVAIGDRFTWDDQRYEVMEVVREKYWGNTNRPTHLRMTAKRWQDSVNDLDCDNIGTPGPFAGGQGSALGDC